MSFPPLILMLDHAGLLGRQLLYVSIEDHVFLFCL